MSLLLAVQSVAYTLSIDQGSYSFIGNDISILKNSKINLDQGVYSLNGGDINFNRNYVLSIEQVNYTYTGNDIEFVYTTPPILGAGKKISPSFISNFVLK